MRKKQPPETLFHVCRCCRKVMADPQPIAFCGEDCAATWAVCLIDTNRLMARTWLLRFFVCAEPPEKTENWPQSERAAIAQEVC